MARGERWLLVLTPFVAMTAVGAGLRVGASDAIAAATVFSAPVSRAGFGLAWQVVAFRVTGSGREPLARQPLDVTARAGAVSAHWTGSTNEDGVGEMQLPVAGADRVGLEIRSGADVLAKGEARVPPRLERPSVTPVWMPFARREGPVLLDVAVLGQRFAPGFPASIWVRAMDAVTHSRLSGVTLDPEAEGSLTFDRRSSGSVDGWSELTATAAGFAISLTLHARTAEGRTGQWHGGLFASPGAVNIETRRRWAPDEAPTITLIAPTPRTTEYFEIDDASGRVWATAAALGPAGDGTSSATLSAPPLPAGLYWAVAASDPTGASLLGPGTAALPFFVAASDPSALKLGTDRTECAASAGADSASHALGPCLALAAAVPIARWTALDGFSAKNAHLREKRLRGMAIAAGSILVAMGLETLLVLRAAARGRRRRPNDVGGAEDPAHDGPIGESATAELTMSPPYQSAVAVLVAVLGFALVTAFILRWA
jgi:hypothetical protein